MKQKRILGWTETLALAAILSVALDERVRPGPLKAYGIPRGGWNVVGLLPRLTPVDNASDADVLLDDIIDSGKTRDAYLAIFPDKPFLALIDQTSPDFVDYAGAWVVFPWEVGVEDAGPEENVRRLLTFVGEDADREGLRETPKRFLKALREMTSGIATDPKAHLRKVFGQEDGADPTSYGGMILSGPLPFVSLCEHHLAAFDGHAWVGYIPNEEGKIVGLSKLARLLDGYAQRFQVQERLTQQIADAVQEVLQPKAVGVLLRGRHTCQCYRGVKKDGRMLTCSLHGAFLIDASARAEFMQMVTLSQGA